MTAVTQNANIASAASVWKMLTASTTSFMGFLLNRMVEALSGFHVTPEWSAGFDFAKLRSSSVSYLTRTVTA